MTFDQLASVYSIKHGQSLTQKLKEMSRDRRPMSLGDFIAQMTDYFEAVSRNQVRAAGAGNTNGGARRWPHSSGRSGVVQLAFATPSSAFLFSSRLRCSAFPFSKAAMSSFLRAKCRIAQRASGTRSNRRRA